MKKHTGDTWVIHGKTGAGHIGVGPEGEHLSDSVAFVNGKHNEAKANAELVKAAPVLLAACEKVLKRLEGITTDDFSKGGDKDMRDILKAALLYAELKED